MHLELHLPSCTWTSTMLVKYLPIDNVNILWLPCGSWPMSGSAHLSGSIRTTGKTCWAFATKQSCFASFFDFANEEVKFVGWCMDLAAWFRPLRFTVCDVCEQLKSQLHDKSVPLAEKLGAVTRYQQHLKDQYIDRSVAWQMCDVANCQDGDVLVLWLDAMEQAKFAIPRHRGLRTASATFLTQKILDLVQNMSNTADRFLILFSMLRSKLQKPRMKLHGCWAFGYTLQLFCLDDTSKHDATCIIEILALTIQKVPC